VELLTPMVLGGSGVGLVTQAVRMQPKPPRFYRVWRTGAYPDMTHPEGRRVFGVKLDNADLPLAWQLAGDYYVGQTSQPVRALPNGNRFTLPGDAAEAAAAAFVHGLGRPDWAGLGWGQLFIPIKDVAHEY
jgi:hypothetical protein